MNMYKRYGMYLEADKGGAGGSDGGDKQQSNDQHGDGEKPLVFDAWLKEQDESVQQMLDGHTRGLKSALDGERDNRKKLERELRDLAGKAEKGSEAQTQLTKMADQVAEADQKAEFYEQAHAAGVSNLKLAYLVAQNDDLIDKRGRVNFETLKATYPELFGGKPKTPAGNAGSGTDKDKPASATMNDYIRKAAGRV